MEVGSKSLRFFRMPKRPNQLHMHAKQIDEKVKIVHQSTCDSSVTTAEDLMAAETLCDREELRGESVIKNGIEEKDLCESVEKNKTEEFLERLERCEVKNLENKVTLFIDTWAQLTEECRQLPSIAEMFNKLFQKTIQTVLSDEWHGVGHATRCRMSRVLTRCSQQLGHVVAHAPSLCASLIMSVYDPWGEDGPDDFNVERFLISEPAELVLARVESLWKAEKEDLAMKLCQCYIKSSVTPSQCRDRTQLGYDPDVEQEERRQTLLPFLEWLVRILHRKKRLRDIVTETENCTCHEGVQLIRRITEDSSQEDLSLAEILTHLFLVRDLLYPSTYCCTKELMMMWTSLHVKQRRTLKEVAIAAKKLIVLHASTSAHFYLFVDVLWEEFGHSLFPLYLEMYVRGLTADLNHLEVARQEKSVTAVLEMETHVAGVYTKLGSLFSPGEEIFARQCVLSAFSVEPTPERLQLLHYLTVAISIRNRHAAADENGPEVEAQEVVRDMVGVVSRLHESMDVDSDPVSGATEVLDDVSVAGAATESFDDVNVNVRLKVDEMLSVVADRVKEMQSDFSEMKELLHLPLESDSTQSEAIGHKCNCGRLCTTPSDDEGDPAVGCRPTSSCMDFHHPILDTPLEGVHTDLLKDLVIVLESTRHTNLPCGDDWNVMRRPFEDYLDMMAAIRLMLQHSSCYESVDSETDSASEEEFLRKDPVSSLSDAETILSVALHHKSRATHVRHAKTKVHKHSNELAKKKRRKRRRRARKERDRELTVRHVLFDGLEEEEKPPKRKRGRPRKKVKDKFLGQGININTADLSSIVNPNARILLSRLEDSGRHHHTTDLLTRLEEKSEDSLQPIEDIQSHLQSSNLLDQSMVGEPPIQTVPCSSGLSAFCKNAATKPSKLKSKHHKLLKLKKTNKKHRRLKIEKKLKNIVKKKLRKCVNASCQTDAFDLTCNGMFTPIPQALLKNSGVASKGLVDEFGKPLPLDTAMPKVTLPVPPKDQILNNFAPSVCTTTPPLQTKAPSNRFLKKLNSPIPIVKVIMPTLDASKSRDPKSLVRTGGFSCEGMPQSKMSVLNPGKISTAPSVVAVRVHNDKALKAAVSQEVVANPEQSAIIIRGANISAENPSVVGASVNASPQLITFKTISGTPLVASTGSLPQTITSQAVNQAIQIPVSTAIQNAGAKIVAHKLFIPFSKLNSLELMPLAANNLLSSNAQAPNVFIVRPQQQQPQTVQTNVKALPIKAKPQKRFWTSSRDKPPPVYEWRKIGPKKSINPTILQKPIVRVPSAQPSDIVSSASDRTSTSSTVQGSVVARVSVPLPKQESAANQSKVAPNTSSSPKVQQNGFTSGEVVKRRVSTSDLTTLDSSGRVMPLRPISEPLDLNTPVDDARKVPLTALNPESKDLETLDSSISDAVRFSLMFSDDGTGGIENQVGMPNYNSYPDEYLQSESTSYAQPMDSSTNTEFEPRGPSSFEAPSSASAFVSNSPPSVDPGSWKAETSLVELEAKKKKRKNNNNSSSNGKELPVLLKNPKLGVEEIIREIKKKTKAAHEMSGKKSATLKSSGPLCHCETCGRGFVSTYNLRRHYKNVHKMDMASPKSSHGGLTNLSLSSPETPFSPSSDTPISPPCVTNTEKPNFNQKTPSKDVFNKQSAAKKVQPNWHNLSYQDGNFCASHFVEDRLSSKSAVVPEEPMNLGTQSMTLSSKSMQDDQPSCISQVPKIYCEPRVAIISESGVAAAKESSLCFDGTASSENWNSAKLDKLPQSIDPFCYPASLMECNSTASHQALQDKTVTNSQIVRSPWNVAKQKPLRDYSMIRERAESLDVWDDHIGEEIQNNFSASECMQVIEQFEKVKVEASVSGREDLSQSFKEAGIGTSADGGTFGDCCSPNDEIAGLMMENNISLSDGVENNDLPDRVGVATADGNVQKMIERGSFLNEVQKDVSLTELVESAPNMENSHFSDNMQRGMIKNNFLAAECIQTESGHDGHFSAGEIHKHFGDITPSLLKGADTKNIHFANYLQKYNPLILADGIEGTGVENSCLPNRSQNDGGNDLAVIKSIKKEGDDRNRITSDPVQTGLIGNDASVPTSTISSDHFRGDDVEVDSVATDGLHKGKIISIKVENNSGKAKNTQELAAISNFENCTFPDEMQQNVNDVTLGAECYHLKGAISESNRLLLDQSQRQRTENISVVSQTICEGPSSKGFHLSFDRGQIENSPAITENVCEDPDGHFYNQKKREAAVKGLPIIDDVKHSTFLENGCAIKKSSVLPESASEPDDIESVLVKTTSTLDAVQMVECSTSYLPSGSQNGTVEKHSLVSEENQNGASRPRHQIEKNPLLNECLQNGPNYFISSFHDYIRKRMNERDPSETLHSQNEEKSNSCSEADLALHSEAAVRQQDFAAIRNSPEQPRNADWAETRGVAVDNSRVTDCCERGTVCASFPPVQVPVSSQSFHDGLPEIEYCDSDCKITNVVSRDERQSPAEIILESDDEFIQECQSESLLVKENELLSPLPPENNVTRGRTRSREGKKHPKRFCLCCENESPSTKKCRTSGGNGSSPCAKKTSKKPKNRAAIHTRSLQKPRTRSTN